MNMETNSLLRDRWGRIFLITSSFSNPITPYDLALYTSAIPPVAILSSSMYLPNRSGSNIRFYPPEWHT